MKKFSPAALSVLLIPSLLFTFHSSLRCTFAAQRFGEGRKKSSALMAEGVDKSPKMGYSIGTKGATSRRLPQLRKRSNRVLGRRGGYFSLLFIIWKTRRMTVRMTVQNSNKLSHVTYISATPFPYGLGVNKEDYYPLKKGRGGKTAYRGAGSTIDRLTHSSTNCKENVTTIA